MGVDVAIPLADGHCVFFISRGSRFIVSRTVVRRALCKRAIIGTYSVLLVVVV